MTQVGVRELVHVGKKTFSVRSAVQRGSHSFLLGDISRGDMCDLSMLCEKVMNGLPNMAPDFPSTTDNVL